MPRALFYMDKGVIKASIKGDRKAQYRLYTYCYSNLMPVAMRYYKDKNDASSAINFLVVKVLDKYKSRKTHIPFDLWARRILINQAIDDFRKKSRTRKLEESENVQMDRAVENEAILAFDEEAIIGLIKALPEMQKTVFNLFAIDGFAHKEISKMIGISEENSRYYLFDAKKRLRLAYNNGFHKNIFYER